MNSIKFIVAVTIIGLTLAGFISMDSAFKKSFKAAYGIQSLSTTSECLDVENSIITADNVALNLAH
jgi:hypothetical protein